jgi:hypothetical protein
VCGLGGLIFRRECVAVYVRDGRRVGTFGKAGDCFEGSLLIGSLLEEDLTPA